MSYTHPARFDHAFLRRRIVDCRKCAGVFAAPRFGTGEMSDARPDGFTPLMIVGQNPPREPERCLHGAWMLHYRDAQSLAKKEAHELLVERAVKALGLTHKDVYATQAIKCPTAANTQPGHDALMKCSPFLDLEIRECHPQVILTFGTIAHRAVREAMEYPPGPYSTWYCEPKGMSTEGTVRVTDNILDVPHPSRVGRFLHEESWLASIVDGYQLAKQRPRPLTHSEVQYIRDHGDRYGVPYAPPGR